MTTFAQAQVLSLFDKVVSLAQQTGVFRSVNSFEPKRAPGNGPHCSVWCDELRAMPGKSGLSSVTGQVSFHARVYLPFLAKPERDIDRALLTATAALWAAYAASFTLDGTVRNVDLLAMTARAGYITQDSQVYRVMETELPIVINDMFPESA